MARTALTLVELQDILGQNITELNMMSDDEAQRAKTIEKADAVARVAKQMINNADVILRTDKLVSEGKLSSSTIEKVVG